MKNPGVCRLQRVNDEAKINEENFSVLASPDKVEAYYTISKFSSLGIEKNIFQVFKPFSSTFLGCKTPGKRVENKCSIVYSLITDMVAQKAEQATADLRVCGSNPLTNPINVLQQVKGTCGNK